VQLHPHHSRGWENLTLDDEARHLNASMRRGLPLLKLSSESLKEPLANYLRA
jgi:hypothetical protein